MDMIRVMVVDDHDETRELIKKILFIQPDMEVASEAGNGIEAIDSYRDDPVDVILMDINMPVMNGLEAADRISTEYPDAIIVMMSVQSESEYMRKAMDSGARSYIVKPFEVDDLCDSIRSAFNKNRKKDEQPVIYAQGDGRIVSFYGSKGGVGKSILAMNISVMLSQRPDTRTILVDLDLQFGDVGMLMNIKPQKTIVDAIESEYEAVAEKVSAAVINHSAQLDVLLAPKRPDQAEGIHEAEIKQILTFLKNQYDYVVIDLGTNYSEITLSALDLSDIILYISTPDMLSIKNTRLGLDVMRSLDYNFDKVHLVLNRWTGKERISTSDISRALGVEVSAKIRDEKRHMLEMINRGDPIASEKRRRKSKFMKDLTMCTEKII